MREEGGYRHIIAACEAIGKKVDEHIENYGPGVELRLTGAHETAHYTEFSYGVSDRGASIRIPWQVAIDKKGYLEDRRPNANMDPYRVTRVIVNTTCSASSGGSGSSSAKKASSKNGSSKKAGSKKAAKKSASTKTLTSVDVLPKKSSKRR